MVTIVLFGAFFVLAFIGLPIALSLVVSSWVTIISLTDINASTIIQKGFSSMESFSLLALPFFILVGALMNTGGLSRRLLDLANVLIGYVVGGLAMATVLASMFFSAISGSGPATVAAMGSFMLPAMKENNYSPGFSGALLATAGCIGVLIPPSIPIIIYGIVSGVSIGDAFLAGIIPGLLLGVSLMITAYIISKKNNYVGTFKKPRFMDVMRAINSAKYALLLPIIILGGIFGGFFSPTESAAVACVYVLIIGMFVQRELDLKGIYKSFAQASLTSAVVVVIVAFSISFAYLMQIERVPETVTAVLTGISDSPIVILLFINLILLITGMFIDTIPAIVILAPILLPVAADIGVDPIHLGIIIVTNLAIGFVTPPLGANLFVASSIGKIPFGEILRGMVPMSITLLIILLMVTYIPSLSTFIPDFFNK